MFFSRSDIIKSGITLRMFRLNLCSGLPVVALNAENSQEISNRVSGKGAHLEFPGAYGRDSDEKNLRMQVFFVSVY